MYQLCAITPKKEESMNSTIRISIIAFLSLIILGGCSVSLNSVDTTPFGCEDWACEQLLQARVVKGLFVNANVRAFATFDVPDLSYSSGEYEIPLDRLGNSQTYEGSTRWRSNELNYGYYLATCPRSVDFEARGKFLGIFPVSDTERNIVAPGPIENIQLWYSIWRIQNIHLAGSGTTLSISGSAFPDGGFRIDNFYDEDLEIEDATITCNGTDCNSVPENPFDYIPTIETPLTLTCGQYYLIDLRCTSDAVAKGLGGTIQLETSRGILEVNLTCTHALGS